MENRKFLFILISVSFMLAIIYFLVLGNEYGVWVSCEGQEILGIKKLTPPLMTALPPPTICVVDLEVKSSNGSIICSYKKYEMRRLKEIIACNNLKNNLEDNLAKIEIIFYDLLGKREQNRDQKYIKDILKG